MYEFLILVINCVLLSVFVGRYIDRVRCVENTSSKLTLSGHYQTQQIHISRICLCVLYNKYKVLKLSLFLAVVPQWYARAVHY